MLVAQGGLHGMFGLLGTGDAHAGHAGMAMTPAVEPFTWRMVLAHLLSTLLAVLVWWLSQRAATVLIRALDVWSAYAGGRRDAALRVPGCGGAARSAGLSGRSTPPRASGAGRLTSHPSSRPTLRQGRPMSVRRTLTRLGAPLAAAAAVTLVAAGPASAHVTVSPSDATAGAFTVLTVSVPHGCDGSPTTRIELQIPEQILSVTPTRNPFYEVETKVAELDEPADRRGRQRGHRADQQRGLHRRRAVAGRDA